MASQTTLPKNLAKIAEWAGEEYARMLDQHLPDLERSLRDCGATAVSVTGTLKISERRSGDGYELHFVGKPNMSWEGESSVARFDGKQLTLWEAGLSAAS